MIKKLFYLILLLASLRTAAQNLPIGAPSGTVTVQGSLVVDTLFFLPQRSDTLFNPGRPGAMVFAYGQAYLYLGSHWSQMTGIAWGTIPGALTAQHDLDSALNSKQSLISNGYGWKLIGSAGTFDSANVRKVDTVGRLNDSTLFFTINGKQYNVLLRGTAAGASVLSITLNTPTGLFVSNVTYTSDGLGHWTGTLSLSNQSANSFLAGPVSGSPAQPSFRTLQTADLPTGIPNSILQNSTLGLQIGSSGTYPGFSTTSVALGNTIILNLPVATSGITGILSASDWNRFNNAAISGVTNVNGQVGVVVTLNADSLGAYPIDFSNFHNGWVLSVDTIHNKLVFSAPGSGSGLTQLNGLTATIQTFANGFTGTSPNWFSTGSTHTLEIPLVNGSDSGMVTPTLYAYWNAKVNSADSGANGSSNYVTQASRQKLSDSLQAISNALFATKKNAADSAANSSGGYTTQASRQKLSDSLQALIALKKNISDSIANDPGGYTTQASRQKAVDSILGVMNADLALKANIASPTFTGIPAAPTASPGTNTTQLATTAFVANAVSSAGADSGYAVLFAPLAMQAVPVYKQVIGVKRFTLWDTSANNPAAIVTQASRQKLADSIFSVLVNTWYPDTTDPHASRLGRADGSGNLVLRGLVDTSTDGSVTIDTTLSNTHTIVHNFHAAGGSVTINGTTGSSSGSTQTFAVSGLSTTATGLTMPASGSTVTFTYPVAWDFADNTRGANLNYFNGPSVGNTSLSSNNNYGSGVQVMQNCTTCQYDFGAGPQALNAITTGTQNLGIGWVALFNLTTGSFNTAVGPGVMSGDTIGSENVALGGIALDLPGNPNGNTAVGYQAGGAYHGAPLNNTLMGRRNTSSWTGADTAVTSIGAYNDNNNLANRKYAIEMGHHINYGGFVGLQDVIEIGDSINFGNGTNSTLQNITAIGHNLLFWVNNEAIFGTRTQAIMLGDSGVQHYSGLSSLPSIGSGLVWVRDSAAYFEYNPVDAQWEGIQTTWHLPAGGGGSYTFAQSLVNTSGTVTLSGDNATPGNNMVYGTNGSGTKGWYSASGGGSTAVSALTGATASNSIDWANNPQTWSANTLAANTMLTLSTNSTAAASNTQTMLAINMTGTNGTSGQTTTGLSILNTHGGSGTNVAGYFKASGGSTGIALETGGGQIAINTATPIAGSTMDVEANGTNYNETNFGESGITGSAYDWFNFQTHGGVNAAGIWTFASDYTTTTGALADNNFVFRGTQSGGWSIIEQQSASGHIGFYVGGDAASNMAGMIDATRRWIIDTIAGSSLFNLEATRADNFPGANNGYTETVGPGIFTDNTSTGTVAGIWSDVIAQTGITTFHSGVIYTNAASLYIAGPPTANGTVNAPTITNPWALYVNSGSVYLGSTLSVQGVVTFTSSSGIALDVQNGGFEALNTGYIQGLEVSFNGKTSNYTVTQTDNILTCNGTFTVTLPNPLPNGQIITIKNIGTGTITVSAAAGNIDASSTYTLSAQYKYVTVAATGGPNYNIIGQN